MTDSITSLLASISPVLRSVGGSWDGVILSELSEERLNDVLQVFYTGR